ncbi:DUF418 domain-containing protein [Actinomycetaceae bacterium L2_0104]
MTAHRENRATEGAHAAENPSAADGVSAAGASAMGISPAGAPPSPAPSSPGAVPPTGAVPPASPTLPAPTPAALATPPGTSNPRQPARYHGRIGGLDIARALAIFGMFYAHVAPVTFYEGFPAFLDAIPDGRSSILFAVLAGISLSILTGRNVAYAGEQMRGARLRIFGRSAMLLLIAGFLSLMGTPVAIILAFYAAWFVTALPFASWGSRKLFALAGGLAVVGPIVTALFGWVTMNLNIWPSGDANSFVIDVFLTGMYPGAVYMAYVFAGMAIGRLDITRRTIQGALVLVGCGLMILGYGSSWLLTQAFGSETEMYEEFGSYSSSSSSSGFVIESSSVDGEFATSAVPGIDPTVAPADPDSSVIKGDKGTDPNSTSWIKEPTDPGLGSGSGSSSWAEPEDWEYPEPWSWQSIPFPDATTWIGAVPHTNTIFEAVGSGGFAITALGLCLLIGRLARTVLFPLAAVGSMALTAYSIHIVVIGFNLEWVGTESWAPTLWLVGGALVLCTAWKLFFTRGPLEWIMWKVSHKTAHMER